MSTTTRTTSHKGALQGAVAAAAGVAVLLGGAGTFALWNASGAIGTTGTATGRLTADFGEATWTDVTPNGTDHPIADVTAFRLVPGDVLEGTVPVEVVAEGENIRVTADVTYGAGFALPEDVTATVALRDDQGAPVTQLGDTGATPVDLTAVVTLTFEQGADASMAEPVDLSRVNVSLDQVGPQNVRP